MTTEFFACEHPMHVKYVVGGRGIVCTACDPEWYVNPLLEWENPLWTARFREVFDSLAALCTPQDPADVPGGTTDTRARTTGAPAGAQGRETRARSKVAPTDGDAGQ